jgi:hypothetical protein
MMIKLLFTSALVLSSALAQAATAEQQELTNIIVATFNLNQVRTTEPSRFGSMDSSSVLDSQGHLKANLGSHQVGSGTLPTLTFKDAKSLAFTVNQRLLTELTQNGSVNPNEDGSLHMTAGAKNRLVLGAVNTSGIVEARHVIIQDGLVILSGQ